MVQPTPQTCPECGQEFSHKDPRRVFCATAHKRAWNNRALGRGAPLVLLMQAWRQGRHARGSKAAKHAFTELCLAIDAANTEDREAGRPGALKLYEARLRRQGLAGLT